ncbi:MAG: MlaE family lipid ABC transporter permease subunit [Gammaproteobacteria bacterium]|nr:MlaE family lipid ABC transporter permease subunit [Gammaproteobacteria bacterium]
MSVPHRPSRHAGTAPALSADEPSGAVLIAGDWTTDELTTLDALVSDFNPGATLSASASIDLSGLSTLDTNGAWLVHKLRARLQAGSKGALPIVGASHEHQALIALIDANTPTPEADTSPPRPNWLHQLGKASADASAHAVGLLSFVGEVTLSLLKSVLRPASWRPGAILSVIQQAGVQALPIVGLLAFLMGVVIGYQGGVQLKTYGANIFVVELLTLSIIREIAPLVTAIIVAGRSGSAYAAELATMQVNEEVDALKVMGVHPIELLVLPKLIGLIVALPLLTVFADIAGVAGGMAIASVLLGVGVDEFINRIPDVIPLSSFVVGIVKVPVFAAIICIVGCYQGLTAGGGAEGVGRQTTASVVQAIFLVIVADAIFSIIYSVLDI